MFPAQSSQQRLSAGTSTTSKKVPLKQGRSLVDWIRLAKSGADLKGTGLRLLNITSAELAKHNKPDDVWICIRGLVYNVTTYIEYHPGGADELMRGAGRDATVLFEEVHRWVNFEAMLKECLVGRLSDPPANLKSKSSLNRGGLLAPPPSLASLNPLGRNSLHPENLNTKDHQGSVPEIKLQDYATTSTSSVANSITDDSQANPAIGFEWYQTDNELMIVLHGRDVTIKEQDIISDIVNNNEIYIDVYSTSKIYTFHIHLSGRIRNELSVKVSKLNKAKLAFHKEKLGTQWKTLGMVHKNQNALLGRSVNELRFFKCTIASKNELTHDTALYHIRMPDSRWMSVPVGRHVFVKDVIDGIEIRKPYTAVVKDVTSPGTNEKQDCEIGKDLFLAIKHYEHGALTSRLRMLSFGSQLQISTYDGDFDISHLNGFGCILMLAAGTGITPMIGILQLVLNQLEEKEVHLLFFNKQQNDIIWSKEFYALQNKHGDRFHITNVLSNGNEYWTETRGRISEELMKDYMDKKVTTYKNIDIFFLICGPALFTKSGLSIIRSLGIDNGHAFT